MLRWVVGEPGISCIAKGKCNTLTIHKRLRANDGSQRAVKDSAMRNDQITARAVPYYSFHGSCAAAVDFPITFASAAERLVWTAKV